MYASFNAEADEILKIIYVYVPIVPKFVILAVVPV